MINHQGAIIGTSINSYQLYEHIKNQLKTKNSQEILYGGPRGHMQVYTCMNTGSFETYPSTGLVMIPGGYSCMIGQGRAAES